MALTEKLGNIADAIRGKTGKTEEMTLEQMAADIAGIQTGDGPGGGSDMLSVDTGHYALTAQMVTIGANTVTETAAVKSYFLGVVGGDDINGLALLETEYTENNQFICYLGGPEQTNAQNTKRYRNGVVGNCMWNNAGYDAKIVEGTHYLVFTVRKYTE